MAAANKQSVAAGDDGFGVKVWARESRVAPGSTRAFDIDEASPTTPCSFRIIAVWSQTRRHGAKLRRSVAGDPAATAWRQQFGTSRGAVRDSMALCMTLETRIDSGRGTPNTAPASSRQAQSEERRWPS